MDPLEESLSEPERYLTAIGWQPEDPYKKLLEKARKELAAMPRASDSMLSTRPATGWSLPNVDRKAVSPELFSTFWHVGEVAVLLGEKGVGKSILAVQIAESIARGRAALSEPGAVATGAFNTRSHAPTPPRRVLYLDFQRTAAQWTERYSVPSPIPGKLPVRYRFSPRLIRSAIEWDGDLPDAFNGSITKYLEHSIRYAIADSDAKVVVIDDISYLSRLTGGSTGAIKAMHSLKLWASTNGLSILVVVPAKEKRRPKPAALNDALGSPQICQQADTVFYLAPSTFGPEYRYLKHLASPRQITHTPENLLTFELKRSPALVGSPRVSKGPTPNLTSTDLQSLASMSPVSPSPASPSPDTPTPFLGLTHLGPSRESDHLHNYQAESEAANRAQESALKRLTRRTATATLVDGMLDGSYGRYLRGE